MVSLLAASQTLALLINVGECGRQVREEFVFLQRLLGARCTDQVLEISWFSPTESLVARGIYAVMLVLAVLSMETRHGKLIDTSLPNPSH